MEGASLSSGRCIVQFFVPLLCCYVIKCMNTETDKMIYIENVRQTLRREGISVFNPFQRGFKLG